MIRKPKSIREQVYESLKEDIINANIKSGQKIVEIEYANRLGVSRTPLREALRMLELEGLVSTAKNGGVFVNYISENDIKEIYRSRIALESLILAELVQRPRQEIEQIAQLMHEAGLLLEEEMIDYEKVIHAFEEFNYRMYRTSQLVHVPKLIMNLNQFTRRFRTMCLRDNQRLFEAYEEHCQLIDALKKRDLESAIKINEKHLNSSMHFVLRKVDTQRRLERGEEECAKSLCLE